MLVDLAGVRLDDAFQRVGVLLEHPVEELAVLLGPHPWGETAQCLLHIAPHGEVELGAAAQVLRADVDLGDLDVVGEERVVREVGAEEDQQIALVGGLAGGAVAEQYAHADVVRIVVLDVLLAPQRVPHRGLDLLRELHDLGVRARGAAAAEQGDLVGRVDHLDEPVDLGVAGAGSSAMSPGRETTSGPTACLNGRPLHGTCRVPRRSSCCPQYVSPGGSSGIGVRAAEMTTIPTAPGEASVGSCFTSPSRGLPRSYQASTGA